jgi:Glycosyltransferase family 87
MTVRRLTILVLLPLLLGLLVPVSGHGDMYLSTYNSSLILTDHPNVYHAVADEPSGILPNGLSGAPYGPLFYYPTALWLQALDTAHLINVQGWQSDTFDSILRDLPVTFLLKLPYLAVYLLVASVLTKTLRDRRGKIAAVLWLVNPAVILYGLLMGQNDGWAFLASAIGLSLAMGAREGNGLRIGGREVPLRLLAMIALAVGAAIKLTPILLVIPFAMVLGRSYREKALLAGAGISAFAVLVAPFLWTPYFWDHGLFGTQAGKASPAGNATLAVLYVAFLAFLWLRRPREDKERGPLLIFSFLAAHALIYFLPEWNPQRSILMLGALALAVPVRRGFLVPYLIVTVYALVLTLDHGNDLGTGLFAPLTRRVFDIPPLDTVIPYEPLRTVFFWLGAAAWVGALALFWRTRGEDRPAYAPAPLLAPALLGSFVVYLVAVFLVHGDVAVSPYLTPAPPQVVPAGGEFAFSFFSGRDDVRRIEFTVLRGDTIAELTVEGGSDGVLLPPRIVAVGPGTNRIDLGYVEDAYRTLFRVSLTPMRPFEVEMAEVPAAAVLASADLDGVPLKGTVAFTLVFETKRDVLLEDAGRRMREEWPTVIASLVLSFIMLGLIGHQRGAQVS